MRNNSLLTWTGYLALAVANQVLADVPGDSRQDLLDQIEEVKVTASRREESLREVPTAISAYAGNQLQQAQITSLLDLAATTPNVQISTFATTANIVVRGIGNSQTTAGSDPGVAVHSDGVYVGQSGLTTSTFLDVSRVEILRGPQGTLFGRNATGGAVNIIPNLPTSQLSAGADGSFGTDPTLMRSSAYISGPLTDSGELRGRVAVQQNYNEGFARNRVTSGPDRLDGIDSKTGRAQLQWLPSEDFTARLLVEYAKASDHGPAQYLLGTPTPNQPLPASIRGALTGDVEARTVYANQGMRDLSSKTANLTTDWNIGRGDLRFLVSYNESTQDTDQDGDGTGVDFTSTSYRNSARQRYAEVLYASDSAEKFTYVIGANFFHENLVQEIVVPIEGLPVPVDLGGTIETTSYAGFLHMQYELMADTKVFAGARHSHDKRSIDEFNVFVGKGSQQDSWARPTYEVGVTHDFNESVSSYLKYATGYKSGGFSAGALSAPFDPETNKNIEAGLKGSYLDGHLQANLAAFHMTYSNLQVNQVTGVTASVTNAAEATIDGVEAEVVIAPAENLRVLWSGAWLDARFDEFVTADSARPSLGILSLAGNRLPQAPRFTTSLGMYYDIPLAMGGQLTPGVRFDWKSQRYFSEFNVPVSSQDAAGTLDLFLRYESNDERWSASLFALNATDKRIKSGTLVVSALLGSLAIGQYEPGRQIGASVGYHF